MLNPTLTMIYDRGEVTTADGRVINPFPTATPRPVAEGLYRLVKEADARRTLEVGMAYGLSTLAICQAHAERGEGAHIAIDPVQRSSFGATALSNIDRAGYGPHFVAHEAGSETVLPRLLAEGTELDFAFIDGSHLFDFVFVDFFYLDRMLRRGGLIVFDDVWMPAVRRVISFARHHRHYRLVPSSVRSRGLGHRLLRRGRRLVNGLGTQDRSGLRFDDAPIAVLQKTADDTRKWDDWRPF